MSDIARDVTVDSSGNVYVVGKSIQSLAGESGTDVAAILVKFDSSGNRKWTRIAGAGSAWAVAVDNSGNVFVGGGFIDDKYDDVYGEGAGAVAKFDESGNPQWLSLFGTGGNVEISRDLATDKSGAVYMAGGTRASEVGQDKNSGGTDALAASYEAAGSRQWARLLGSSKDDAASGVAVDSSGNSYFVGTAGGGLRGNPDVDRLGFLSKYDASGGRTWLKTSSSTFSTHVTTGSSGGVYLSGFTEGDVDASVPFLAKRDASGEQAWMQKLRETSDGARIADTVGVVVGNSGNIHVAGGVVTDRETTDAYVGAFDDSGTQQWSHTTDFSADIRPHSFAVDGSDNVYVVGRTYEDLAGQTNQGDSDLFVARIEK